MNPRRFKDLIGSKIKHDLTQLNIAEFMSLQSEIGVPEEIIRDLSNKQNYIYVMCSGRRNIF